MRNFALGSFMTLTALTLAGCIESTQIITVNPDGSGKTQMDNIMAPPPQMGMGGPNAPKPDPEKLAKTTVGAMLANPSIEAWSDVSYEVLNDGRIHIKATGFFKDLSKLSVLPGEGNKGDQGYRWAKSDKGGMELALNMDKKNKNAAAAAPPQLTNDEVAAKVKESKMQYQQMKPMMTMMLGSLKIDTTFQLPGMVQEVNNFKKTEKGVQLVIEGKKLMEVMDKAATDDKMIEAQVRSGKNGMEDQPENFNEMMFGSKGGITARVDGDLKPQFDYAADMGKAKAAQDEMLKKLGVEIKAPTMQFGPPPGP